MLNPTGHRHVGQPDWWLLGITLIMVTLGLMMVYSATGVSSALRQSDSYYYFKRQSLFAFVGLLCMIFCAGMSRSMLYKLQYPALFGAILLLILTISPLGVRVNGAQRWLGIGSFRVQPMEFTKIGLVLYLAYFMATKQAIIKTFSKGVIPPFLVTGAICILLLAQPDFGGAALMLLILLFMCLAGGTRSIYLVISVALACGAAYLLVSGAEYRSRRILAFLDPYAVRTDAGYQLWQALLAFGSGGFSGSGLGASRQKLFYLPEQHTDFILAVFGEETGFLGMAILISLVIAFFWRGLLIVLRQDNLRDRFTSFGLVLVLALSFALNMAVVMGAAPPKGVPMPFFSYGGSSIVASFICVGLLLNLSRTGKGS